MWTCPRCRERLEESFDLCWNCGSLRGDGSHPPPPQPGDEAGSSAGEELGGIEPSDHSPPPVLEEDHRPTRLVTGTGPITEGVALALYARAGELLDEGKTVAQIEQGLVAEGLEPEAARVVVNKLLDTRHSVARKNMLHGGLWCVGGLIVTVGTWILAAGGGSYLVAWGAILYGGLQFTHGKVQAMGLPARW